MAKSQRNCPGPRGASLLGRAHRDHLRIRGGVRAHLSRFADSCRVARRISAGPSLDWPPHLHRFPDSLISSLAQTRCPVAPPNGPLLKLLAEVRMAVSQDLLDILVCPVCKTPVKLVTGQKWLDCDTCEKGYAVN